ncbi:hypothetical protein TUM4438_16360 [Shewanella sairae]|uniref:histidine kinase n=1 Tax=Shewanella sairae TaxID=190310 RepID=A0ABQ4PB76_9GAMM|nr:ATP-binding protein [Shewanella sairae]GIU44657.1 hypothetical protein TUM4438_16360 [Shewanella sairae]
MSKQGSWSIKQYLLAGSIAIIILLIINIAMAQYVSKTRTSLLTLENEVVVAANTLLMIRRNEKDFISRVEQKYQLQVVTLRAELEQQLTRISLQLARSELAVSYDNQKAIANLRAYQQTFFLLVQEIYRIKGIAGQQGYLQYFENSSKALQLLTNELQDTELLTMIINVQATVFKFFESYNPLLLSDIKLQFNLIEDEIGTKEQSKQPLLEAFIAFERAFFQLQQAQESKGYSESLGYHGALRANVHSVEASLDNLFNQIPQQVEKRISVLTRNRSVIELLLVLSIIFILYYIFHSITRMERGLIFARQKEAQANRAKSSFLANMSHEIRTPLNGIIGMTEILTDSNLSAIQKDYLATINSSSQTLLMLINDILDLSKIESGHLEICPHTCSIKEVIYDTAALIAPKAQQKNIALRITMAQDIPTYIKADEQKLRQVLMNLASNAIKFTESGSVSFQLVIEAETDKDICLLFSVKDTGCGIDSSKHERIFEEFQQAESNTSVEYGGTGLGLSISAKIVSMMGGKIVINSTKNMGSEFYFSLVFSKQKKPRIDEKSHQHLIYCATQHNPLLVQNIKSLNYQLDKTHKVEEVIPLLKQSSVIVLNIEDVSSKAVLARIAAEFSGSPLLIARQNNAKHEDFGDLVAGYITLPLLGVRLDTLIKSISHRYLQKEIFAPTPGKAKNNKRMVLVVEDNKVNQQVVSINLNKLDLPYLIANDGKEALEHYKRNIGNFSVILMDCMMPIMDGFEATRAIRLFEQQEDAQRVKIIALTASILDDDIQKCFDSGMDDYLPKPFKREVLVDKLAKLH